MIYGGSILVDSSVNISRATGIPEMVIGATVVSIATTLPELLVTVYSCFNGLPDLAIGNAVGSMLFNLTLIVGLCISFLPQKIDYKNTLLNISFLFISSLLFYIFIADGDFSRWQGLILIGVFIVSLICNIISGKKKVVEVSVKIFSNQSKESIWKNIALFILGTALVSVGANFLVKYGEILAKSIGVDEHVIGVTVIAIGTSLPDLVTAINSIKLKKTSIAIGNTIGANIINSTLLVGMSSQFSKQQITITPNVIYFAMPMLFASLLILFLPIAIKKRTYRWQGIFLLCITIGYYLTLLL